MVSKGMSATAGMSVSKITLITSLNIPKN